MDNGYWKSCYNMVEKEKTKKELQFDKDSNVLLIGCEGDTDQEMYQKLVNQK